MQYLQNLKKLCEINSKSKIKGKFNKSGINRAQATYIGFFKGLPIMVERIKSQAGADLVLIKSKKRNSNRPKILLSGHIDTVLTPEEVEFKIENEKIFGSGVSDMKGGLIVMNEVLLRLHKIRSLENIDTIVSPEEEIALPNHRQNLEKIAKNYDIILVYESTLDSMSNFYLKDRGVVVSRRGYQQFKLTIQTSGGHSGSVIDKEKRVNANLIMAEIILEIENLADYQNRLTFNTGLIKGGKAVNIISPFCEITFDCRFATAVQHQLAIEQVKALVKKFQNKYQSANFDLEIQDSFPSMDENPKTISLIEEFRKQFSKTIHLEKRNGGSEASVFAHANPDAIVLDGLGVRGEGQHTTGEIAYISSFEDAIQFSLELIKKLMKI